jgi:hypothetical protein
MCVNKLQRTDKKAGVKYEFPCGKCYECRSRRISGWAFRLQKEAEISNSAFFITLTYNDENVPHSQNKLLTLQKRDLQLWFKRVRKLNKLKLTYYAVGEYGKSTLRPHYHVIMFNVDPSTILDTWKQGHVQIGTVTEASVIYTLKYLCKQGKVGLGEWDDRVPEFQLMSKGIGENYINRQTIKYHRADLTERCYLTNKGGYKIAMPRYYKNRIYSPDELKFIGIHHGNKEWEKQHNMNMQELSDYMENKWKEQREKARRFAIRKVIEKI